MSKNIYILPTDKPSRLYEFGGEYFIQNKPQENFRSFHIYITNNEKPNNGEWMISLTDDESYEEVYKVKDHFVDDVDKTIILTTDQDLIKDGVQTIDDEFLEWFVKNPSCERVEFEKEHDDTVPYLKMRYCKPYKIIIPKE